MFRPASSQLKTRNPEPETRNGTRGDFRLKAQFVAGLHAGLGEGLVVEELLARAAMMEFVTHDLAVRTVQRQIHFLDEQEKDAVNRHVVGSFDLA